SRGLQFSVSYTFSRSIDDTSNPGGGANTDGTEDRGWGLDTGNNWGNQLEPRANPGLSAFDRTHYPPVSAIWHLPQPSWIGTSTARTLVTGWQVSGVGIAMSGLAVDMFDPSGGSLYGLFAGARPSFAPGATRRTATENIPPTFSFNPAAFTEAIVQAR